MCLLIFYGGGQELVLFHEIHQMWLLKKLFAFCCFHPIRADWGGAPLRKQIRSLNRQMRWVSISRGLRTNPAGSNGCLHYSTGPSRIYGVSKLTLELLMDSRLHGADPSPHQQFLLSLFCCPLVVVNKYSVYIQTPSWWKPAKNECRSVFSHQWVLPVFQENDPLQKRSL